MPAKKDYTAERYKYADNNGFPKPASHKNTILLGERIKTAYQKYNPKFAAHFEATGTLAAPLNKRFTNQNKNIHGRVFVYLSHRLLDQMDYRDVSLIRYILEPEKRAEVLQKVIDRAKKAHNKTVITDAVKTGLNYRINTPLIPMANQLALKDHAQLLGNMIDAKGKNSPDYDTEIQVQFDNLDQRLQQTKSLPHKIDIYTHMCGLHTDAKKREQYFDRAFAFNETLKEGPKKGVHYKDLRQCAPDDIRRAEAHARMLGNFSFDDTVKDTLGLKESGFKTYAELMIASGKYINEHRNDTRETKRIYDSTRKELRSEIFMLSVLP